jgi:hypothetical protein
MIFGSRNKRGRLIEIVPEGSPTYSSRPSSNYALPLLKLGGVLLLTGIAGLGIRDFVIKPYGEDRQWYAKSVVETDEISRLAREGNYLEATRREMALWSDISTKKREGSYVKDSEMADISNRLNNNNVLFSN